MAGVLVIVVLAVVLLTRGGGSSGPRSKTAAQSHGSATTVSTTAHHKAKPRVIKEKAAPPAETSVIVLNGTETEGLATRTASELQQTGYSEAAARYGRPPGANEVTVVEYSSGAQADAEGVAHQLSVSHVEPMEQAVEDMAEGAKVVVIVGADRSGSGG